MCRYQEKLEYFADSHLDAKNSINRTPKGLTFVSKWGSLRHAAGAAGILGVYSRGLKNRGQKAKADKIMKFAEHQVRSLSLP